MKLIVGLGNPGEKYEDTRHNIGFKVIDYLVEEYNGTVFREKFQGLISEITYKDDKILLLKPQTYMNLSWVEQKIEAWTRIGQWVLMPILKADFEVVESMWNSDRWGFWSTWVK